MAEDCSFWYLKDLPIYKESKPYIINLPLSHIPNGERTNQECYAQPAIKVTDIRTCPADFELDRNGFEMSKSIPISLSYEDFNDSIKVKEIYCKGVKEALINQTGAESAHVLHQMVG